MASFVITDLETGRHPTRETETSSEYDIYSPGYVVIRPGETVTIHTGVSIKLPEDHLFILKSGIFWRLGVITESETIDSSYFPKEIAIVLKNSTKTAFLVKPNDRISQGFIIRYERVICDVPLAIN